MGYSSYNYFDQLGNGSDTIISVFLKDREFSNNAVHAVSMDESLIYEVCGSVTSGSVEEALNSEEKVILVDPVGTAELNGIEYKVGDKIRFNTVEIRKKNYLAYENDAECEIAAIVTGSRSYDNTTLYAGSSCWLIFSTDEGVKLGMCDEGNYSHMLIRYRDGLTDDEKTAAAEELYNLPELFRHSLDCHGYTSLTEMKINSAQVLLLSIFF